MIKINDEVYEYSKFPNGEIKFTDVGIPNSPIAIIEWIYENNEEFFIIQMLVKYFENGFVIPDCCDFDKVRERVNKYFE